MAERFIRRTYAALVRHFQLDGSTPPMWLTDRVVPTVLIHSHLEDLALSNTLDLSGAGGIALQVPSASEPALMAGGYRITWCLSWDIAVGATETYNLALVAPNGVTLPAMVRFMFGQAGNQEGIAHGELTVSIPDGYRVQASTSAQLAADFSVASLCVQHI